MHISVSQLRQHEVVIAYMMILCPSMTLTIRSATLTFQACTKVDGSYLHTSLLWMGISCCTKQVILMDHISLVSMDSQMHRLNNSLPRSSSYWVITQGYRNYTTHTHYYWEPPDCHWISLLAVSIPSTTGLDVLHLQLASQCLGLCAVLTGKNSLRESWAIEATTSQWCFHNEPVYGLSSHFPPITLKDLKASKKVQAITLVDITESSGSHILKCFFNSPRHRSRSSM